MIAHGQRHRDLGTWTRVPPRMVRGVGIEQTLGTIRARCWRRAVPAVTFISVESLTGLGPPVSASASWWRGRNHRHQTCSLSRSISSSSASSSLRGSSSPGGRRARRRSGRRRSHWGRGAAVRRPVRPKAQPTREATAEHRWDVDLVLHLLRTANVSAEIERDLCTGGCVCASGTPRLVTTGARPCHGSIGQPHIPRLQQQQDGATDEQDNKRRSDVVKPRTLRRGGSRSCDA
jgi:hypothetical protein